MRALGLLAGYAMDRRWGDPRSRHPVAGFGRLAQQLEARTWADSRQAGVLFTSTLVGGAAAAGLLAERATRHRPWLRFLATAATTWTVLGGRSLEQEAQAIRRHLDSGDLPRARAQLTHLVGRDTEFLDEAGVARATVESLAENSSDAVVAPLLAGAAWGLPGLLAYRAANTLDAMVGYRTKRYANFGWASARLDDVLNWIPARVSAGLAVALAPTVGGRGGGAWNAWRRDAPGHPSPNAGTVEAAFAGALGIQLGGVNSYNGRREDRPTLGDGRPPSRSDIGTATHLAKLIGHACAVVAFCWSRR